MSTTITNLYFVYIVNFIHKKNINLLKADKLLNC